MFLQSWYKVGLALRVSRYKADRSHEFIPRYKFLGVHLCSVGMQSVSKPIIYPGAGFNLCADAGIRVQKPFKFVLVAGTKAKTVTSPLIIPSVLPVGFFQAILTDWSRSSILKLIFAFKALKTLIIVSNLASVRLFSILEICAF